MQLEESSNHKSAILHARENPVVSGRRDVTQGKPGVDSIDRQMTNCSGGCATLFKTLSWDSLSHLQPNQLISSADSCHQLIVEICCAARLPQWCSI